jgi:putative ABC transport system permease protein
MPGLMEWLDFNGVVPRDVKLQAWLAMAFLAVCLFNTIGLLLAKFLRRGGEIGVRRALGATRGAIFAQCLVEAGLVGVVGGVLGLLLTLAGLWAVRSQPIEYADLARLDLPMFAATFAMAIAASLAAGLFPALRASRVVPAMQLKTL